MALDNMKSARRPFDLPRDKPRIERTEHANLDRPGAVLHPRATSRAWRVGASPDWQRQRQTVAWR